MHRTEVVSTLQFLESIVSAILHWISMELYGWFGFVVFCSLWLRASAANIMGRKFLSDLARGQLGAYGDWLLGRCFICLGHLFYYFYSFHIYGKI